MKLEFSPRFPSCIYHLVVKNYKSPDSLFGKVNVRKNYSFDNAKEVFLKVWNHGLEEAVLNAPVCGKEVASEQISKDEREFFSPDAEHRTVNYRGLLFVAQLVSRDTTQIDQLWFIHSHNKDNIILCVDFEDDKERSRFNDIAKRLGFKNGQDLLQKYVIQLFNEHEK